MGIDDRLMVQRLISRRSFIAGSAGFAALTLLAACGDDDDSGDDDEPSATEAGSGSGAAGETETTGTAASPTTGGGGGTPTQGGEIIIGTLGEAQTINPFVSNETEGDWRVKMLFDQFVRIDPETFEAKPGIAQSWEANELTFTFTLQDGITFSDGTELTTEDIAFTLRGILAQQTASPRASYFFAIQGAQEFSTGAADDVPGIVVVDPQTLEITLGTPDAAFLINLRFCSPVPMALLDGKDLSNASQDPFFQNPVGAGPFMFVSWSVGGDFVAERNPNYFQEGLPYLDKFTHRTIPDSQALVNALLGGDIDGSLYPSPSGHGELSDNEDLTVVVSPFTSPDGWQFNLDAHPYLSIKEVRQAVAYALDMVQFSEDSLYGLGEPGVGPLAPGNWAFAEGLTPYEYNMDKARELLEAAGPPPEGITFMVNRGNVLREDCLTYTQAQLAELGWNIEPEVIEWATLTDRVTRKDFMVLGSVFSGATVSPSDLREQFHTGGSQNYSNYSNPQMDELLDRATQELDQEAAKEIWAEVQQLIMDEVPTHYAWYRPFVHVIGAKYKGWVDSAGTGGLFSELENVYIEE